MAKNPTHLYHYTTAEGLIGIVQHHELWATDIFYMNDRSEFRHGLHLASVFLQTDEAKERYGEDALRIADSLETLGPEAIGFRLFVCCFSQEADNLDQWRAYCPHGGYAIGLPIDSLDVCMSDPPVWLRPCVYKEDEQRASMTKHVAKVGRTLDDLVTSLINEAMRYKNASFEREAEWRLVHTTSCTGVSNALFTTYCFRSHNGRVIPYAKLRLTDSGLWRRAKVIVGPRPEEEMAESMTTVRSLLDYVDPDDHDKVVRSSVPYRHW